jgi:hypothetical protein
MPTPTITTPWVPLWPLDTGGSYTTCELIPSIVDENNVTGEGEAFLVDAATRTKRFIWTVPANYVSGPMTLKVMLRVGAAGTAVLRKSTFRMRDGAALTTLESVVNLDTVFDLNSHIITIATIAAGNFQIGDQIRVDLTRQGADAADTAVSSVVIEGASVVYTGLVSNTLGYALPYATTLPASPTDGQVAVLVDNVINPTYQWQFRYNAASTSPYKWEFIGGTDAYAENANSESTSAANTWVDLATVGPRIIVPRAGDYQAFGGANGSPTATNVWFMMGIAVGATNPVGMYGSNVYTYASTGYPMHVTTGGRVLGVAAGNDLRLRYQSYHAGSSTSFNMRWIRVQPIRVS